MADSISGNTFNSTNGIVMVGGQNNSASLGAAGPDPVQDVLTAVRALASSRAGEEQAELRAGADELESTPRGEKLRLAVVLGRLQGVVSRVSSTTTEVAAASTAIASALRAFGL